MALSYIIATTKRKHFCHITYNKTNKVEFILLFGTYNTLTLLHC